MSSLFPKWTNILPTVMALGAVGGLTGVVGGFWYYATPKFYDVGYMPTQPGGGFNHQIHAGKLGMDCRYCHTKIEQSAEANIPNVATCYGCHAPGNLTQYNESQVHKEKTEFVRQAYSTDMPVEWRRVHKVADYVRNFPHDVHLNAGVSCYSCHGRIDKMPVVYQHEPLSMGWCLDCHRGSAEEPQKYLVPKDKVTQLEWVENHLADMRNPSKSGKDSGLTQKVMDSLKDNPPPQNCGACHY